MKFDHRLPLVLAAMALTLPAQTWAEVGDAGDLPTTANVTAGTGPLARIDGTLSSAKDVDLYLLRVDDRDVLLLDGRRRRLRHTAVDVRDRCLT